MPVRAPDFESTLALAAHLAADRGAPTPGTVDYLSALSHADAVRRILGDERVATQAARAAARLEDPEPLAWLPGEAEQLAAELGSAEVTAAHLLGALTRSARSPAREALRQAGFDVATLRARLVRELTSPRRRTVRVGDEPTAVGRLRRPTPPPRPERVTTPVPVEPAPAPRAPRKTLELQAPRRTLEVQAPAPRRSAAAPRPRAPSLLVGREREIERVLDALSKREAPLPCLVGEPGVGKTALGLALGERGACKKPLRHVDLRVERSPELAPAIAAAAGEALYFLDGIEAAIEDAGLMALLARAEVPCLLAATPIGLRALVAAQPALERRLEVILVPEPDEALLRAILERHAEALGEHHGVRYEPRALDAAARLGARHLAQRFLPDKALALLDLAGSRAHRRGDPACTAEHVAAIVAESTGVPSPRLLMDDGQRLLALEAELGKVIVGHGPALRRIAEVVRRNYAGFRGRRPIGTFLFLGSTGVGKTETAKALAELLMGDERALVRIDLSEYAESHSVARLVGAPPGYVGHEDGGQLSEALRARPYRVVLLDEIERAHRDVQELLLQVLDDARLTDGRGRTIDFSNAVVVMTSNLGAESGDPAQMLETARRALPIELWNRIEEPLVFAPLSRSEVAEVARRLARRASAALERERGIAFSLEEDAVAHLLEHGGYDPELGARPMRGALGRLVEAELAERILRSEVQRGQHVTVAARGGELVFTVRRIRMAS